MQSMQKQEEWQIFLRTVIGTCSLCVLIMHVRLEAHFAMFPQAPIIHTIPLRKYSKGCRGPTREISKIRYHFALSSSTNDMFLSLSRWSLQSYTLTGQKYFVYSCSKNTVNMLNSNTLGWVQCTPHKLVIYSSTMTII